MEYPVFDLDENGQIVSDDMDSVDTFGTIDDVVPSDHDNSVDLQEEENQESSKPSVSDGDASGNMYLETPVLEDISENLERILQEQASSLGYLSTSALDVFDRVVGGYDYDYYIAFRYDSDSYNAVMYLSDHIELSGSNVLLDDCLSVRLYRSRYNSNQPYQYYYGVADAGDVSVNLSGNLMYYTNCVKGYPVLGQEAAPGRYPGWFIPLVAVLIVVVLFSVVRRRN